MQSLPLREDGAVCTVGQARLDKLPQLVWNWLGLFVPQQETTVRSCVPQQEAIVRSSVPQQVTAVRPRGLRSPPCSAILPHPTVSACGLWASR